ncbi:MAG: hypothetical protein AB8G77_10500 [Rhodothermales bacterium]
MSKYFIYTSHGWSASNWLAFALNLHPRIVCSHSARNLLADKKSMNSNANLKKHLTQLHTGYISRLERPIASAYQEIEAMGDADLFGSVHVYRLRDLPVVYQKYGPFKNDFNVMNLVRHPVSLVWSGYGQFKDLFKYDLNELHWTSGKVLKSGREFVNELSRKYDLNVGELENLAFIGAAVVLGSLRLDLDALERVAEIPGIHFKGHTKMEEITKIPNVLTDSIAGLSDNVLHTDASYLTRVYDAGVINEHKKDSNKFDAKARYDQFTDWQKETFNYFFSKFELKSAYEKIGYDFDYLNN